jgi:hypothetical protein
MTALWQRCVKRSPCVKAVTHKRTHAIQIATLGRSTLVISLTPLQVQFIRRHLTWATNLPYAQWWDGWLWPAVTGCFKTTYGSFRAETKTLQRTAALAWLRPLHVQLKAFESVLQILCRDPWLSLCHTISVFYSVPSRKQLSEIMTLMPLKRINFQTPLDNLPWEESFQESY